MLRIIAFALTTSLTILAACAPRPATVDPSDPTITAAIDSLLAIAMDGAAKVDADRVTSIAEGASDLTFVTGDVILTGLEPIRNRFRQTYSLLQSQAQTVVEKRIRVLSPDVAVAIVTAEGTYTDKAGWTSPPVGLGTTIVFVRRDGQWRAEHVHQSIAP